MTDSLLLREGSATPVSALLPAEAGSREVELLRASLARRGARLRSELRLRESPLRVEDTGGGPVLVVRGIAGTLRVGNREVDVVPKHAGADRDWRAGMVVMVERAARRRAAFGRSARERLRHRTFVDQFAAGYALELASATRRYPMLGYRSVTRTLPHLRGRLLVTEQARAAFTRPHRLVCEVGELDHDIPANRLLHWVGERLLTLVGDGHVRRSLTEELRKLPPVSAPVTLPVPLRVPVPQQYGHYASAVALALSFASRRTLFSGTADVDGASFVVGTERLFESFLERALIAVAAEHPGWSVRPQASEPFAEPEGRGRRFHSRPDNVFDVDGVPALIVDAKYKRFEDATEGSGRPTNGDLYQMTAAAVAHDCARALLVYPRLPGAVTSTRWWRVPRRGLPPIRVGAATVDLASLDGGSTREFDRELSVLLLDALRGPAVGAA